MPPTLRLVAGSRSSRPSASRRSPCRPCGRGSHPASSGCRPCRRRRDRRSRRCRRCRPAAPRSNSFWSDGDLVLGAAGLELVLEQLQEVVTDVVAGVPTPSGGAPRSDGVWSFQSATSWSPSRSGFAFAISLASSFARSGKFDASTSLTISPAASNAARRSGGVDRRAEVGPEVEVAGHHGDRRVLLALRRGWAAEPAAAGSAARRRARVRTRRTCERGSRISGSSPHRVRVRAAGPPPALRGFLNTSGGEDCDAGRRPGPWNGANIC